MGTALLSLKGGWTAFLGSAHCSPTFCRVFHWGPRTRSSYTPWKHPHPHELLPFLMCFLSFFMLCYHIRKLITEQQPPRNCSSLTTLKAVWACWMQTSWRQQRQEKQETTMATKVGICLGSCVVVQLCLSICLWQFYRGFEGKGKKFTWCLVHLKNSSPKLQRDFLENSISSQGGHQKIQNRWGLTRKPTKQRHVACIWCEWEGKSITRQKMTMWSKQWVRKIMFFDNTLNEFICLSVHTAFTFWRLSRDDFSECTLCTLKLQ